MPIRPKIIRQIERASAEDVKGLAECGVATVHEAYSRTGLMHGISPVTGGVTVAGPAVTCLNYAGDNLMIHAALEVCKPGDVLVVGLTAPSTHGMFGELLATSCQALGLMGVVLDAGARDSQVLREMRFPVWARAISAAGTEKALPGWVNTPISCGGVVVSPGDVVIADDDGVVVVAREEAHEVLERSVARNQRESAIRPRFAAGELGLDISNLRPRLAGLAEGNPK